MIFHTNGEVDNLNTQTQIISKDVKNVSAEVQGITHNLEKLHVKERTYTLLEKSSLQKYKILLLMSKIWTKI